MLYVSATLAPASENRKASARPMFREPPVMSATRPISSSATSLRLHQQCDQLTDVADVLETGDEIAGGGGPGGPDDFADEVLRLGTRFLEGHRVLRRPAHVSNRP